MTPEEAFKILKEKDWAVETNRWGMWVCGPNRNGFMEVLGSGPSMINAVEKALKEPTHGKSSD